ncbi:distal tail protein [Lactococcus phage vB_Llc_bIBB77s]|uniref:Distal tail protein n=1 Tax=Lactococcus phage vB_Llc_bIBB77s TaxID=2053706 RepID=A0A2Z2XT10_9CAUD|nr:distal tail protein [Lactococcus phage vB_Llc_bIBB77s]
MVRQYKIHTNLDGTDDKVWDVTNGKVRFYQPSNLGLQSTNNILQSNGIGVMGTRSIKQPQIEFKLETFGESLEENYRLMKDFVNDILSKKFVTLEYQTEIFQVYADLALADVTKTEGYGKNGTFSEKITFDIITKWYTYENLTFEKIQNGQVISGKSKIYGGYKGNETPLQNYNRLKASPSLNLPNLNLLKNTRTLTATSTSSWWSTLFSSEQIYDSEIKSKTGVSAMTFSFDVFIPLNTKVGGAVSLQLKGQSSQAHGDVGTNDYNTIICQSWYTIEQSDLGKKISISFQVQIDPKYKNFDSALADTDSITIRQIKDTPGLVYSKLKLEIGSTATPWLPSASEVTTADISEYFGYNYIANQAYTYYGETNIDRLSRWDIKDEIFSFMGILYPQLPKTPTGVRFLDDNGNEYTAIVFKTEQVQNYILINTDVNDEIYQGWNGTTSLNLFPIMDFERYRTRIIERGQMELINLTKAEFKIKRKADFV